MLRQQIDLNYSCRQPVDRSSFKVDVFQKSTLSFKNLDDIMLVLKSSKVIYTKVERAGVHYSCLHSFIQWCHERAIWSFIHLRHRAALLQAAPCIRARIMCAHLFYLGIDDFERVVTYYHRLLLLKLVKQPRSHLVVEVWIQWGLWTAPTPSKPIPCSLQEMAVRWCHRSVCLVLTIDVYDIILFMTYCQKSRTYWDYICVECTMDTLILGRIVAGISS